jgi:1-acyl-sn-glycerol-3-phosphate acyltransferase
MRPPPRLVRRAIVDPLFVPLALVLAAVLAVVAAVAGVCAPFSSRRRVLRLSALALVYVVIDVALLVAGAALWLRHPRRRGLAAQRVWTESHVRLLRWALPKLLAAAHRTMGFRVEVDPRSPALPDDDRPLLFLARHAGPGDSFALVWLIVTHWGRTPRVVLKDVLLWDPGLDVVLTRLSGCFLPSRSGAGDDTTDLVAASAARLSAGDALLLFPEGGNWTPGRQRRAVRRLWHSGERHAARQASAMPEVLPPRPGGTAAALATRPDIDLVVVAHAGLDRLTSVRQLWAAIPVSDTPMRVGWWRVAAEEAPHTEDDVAGWLNRQWTEVARWVTGQAVPDVAQAGAASSGRRLRRPGGG